MSPPEECMASNDHTDDEREQQIAIAGLEESDLDVEDLKELHPDDANNVFDLRAGSETPLDKPLTTVTFQQDGPEGQASWVVNCPYCGGDTHYHDARKHPRIAFDGIGSARCTGTGNSYYLVLKYGCDVSSEIIRFARQSLTNFPGEELQEPLVPRGIDPRVIKSIYPDWD